MAPSFHVCVRRDGVTRRAWGGGGGGGPMPVFKVEHNLLDLFKDLAPGVKPFIRSNLLDLREMY